MSKKRLSKKTKPQRQKNTAIPVSTINSPNFDKILNNQGVELAKQGEFAQAATYFQQAIALNPTEAEFIPSKLPRRSFFECGSPSCLHSRLAVPDDFSTMHVLHYGCPSNIQMSKNR